MNTEKEQKVLEYLEGKGKLTISYNTTCNTKEEMLSVLESQGYSKENMKKSIEEFNSVVSDISNGDLSEETTKKLQKVKTKLSTLRRIFVWNCVELPEIKTIFIS